MKNSIYVIALFCIQSLCFQNCSLNLKKGNGVINVDEIETSAFHKISIGGNYDVILIKSEFNKVIIETDENLLPLINTEVFSQTLNINNIHNLKSTDGIWVKIHYQTLDEIYSLGASNIEHEETLVSEELTINLTGIGAIDLKIQTEKVSLNLTGAGVVMLSGKTNIQNTQISGAGGLRGFELESKTCIVNLSGLGGAEVTATDKLEATISGVGGIIYSGNPKMIERQISGFGKIKRAEEFVDEESI